MSTPLNENTITNKPLKSIEKLSFKQWASSGAPWIWLSAAAVSLSIIAVISLLLLLAINGFSHFWAKPIFQGNYLVPGPEKSITTVVMGSIEQVEKLKHQRFAELNIQLNQVIPNTDDVSRWLVKVGNRDILGNDFAWYWAPQFTSVSYPVNAIVFERRQWGNLYGYLSSVKETGKEINSENLWDTFQERIERAEKLHAQAEKIKKKNIGQINYDLEKLRLQKRKLTKQHEITPLIDFNESLEEINQQEKALNSKYNRYKIQLNSINKKLSRDSFVITTAQGTVKEYPIATIVRAYRPNALNLGEKIFLYCDRLWEFFSAEPREANTEGGIFPAIFGTIMMVLLMSIFVTPLGVIAAIYLHEYAKQNLLTRLIRIAVNNLAGIPSIVYGIFGLGFFIYFIGGHLDQFFYSVNLPAPTFGTPGILWASLTLALLTVPVVIITTEEGLARIPIAIREGSLALGASKIQTLTKIIIPMASPAIMTGMILAIARAAGEVAPLMLVGVVKLAPSLPLDGNFPFVHLERKFMHLGFHIYDVGFQSPNVEASRPLVYATALILVIVIIILNGIAVWIRNHLREKYKALEH